jgi:hypothetical protein
MREMMNSSSLTQGTSHLYLLKIHDILKPLTEVAVDSNIIRRAAEVKLSLN